LPLYNYSAPLLYHQRAGIDFTFAINTARKLFVNIQSLFPKSVFLPDGNNLYEFLKAVWGSERGQITPDEQVKSRRVLEACWLRACAEVQKDESPRRC
jgi:hypothetical protein